jgi:VanZ family protein
VIKLKPSLLPGILWLIISTVLLTLPGSALPKEDFFDKVYFDKWVHIGMFTIMVVLWCWAMLKYTDRGSRKRIFFFMALIWLGYGIVMEFVQLYFIKNRSFDSGDIAADAVGSFAGLFYSMRRYIKK